MPELTRGDLIKIIDKNYKRLKQHFTSVGEIITRIDQENYPFGFKPTSYKKPQRYASEDKLWKTVLRSYKDEMIAVNNLKNV